MNMLTSFFDTLNLDLTTEQSACVERLDSFIKGDKASRIFILRGYAGTGKTTLISGLVKHLRDNSVPFMALAPTGRAARIFSVKSNIEARTIHSAIYTPSETKLDIDDSSYTKKFVLKSNPPANGSIIIIDEASMISNFKNEFETSVFGSGRLLNDIIDFADIENNPNTKLLLVGDAAQLPPVSESFSPALDPAYISNHFGLTADFFELTQVVRHDNGILEAASFIRSSIQDNTLRGIYPKVNNEVSLIPNFSLLETYIKNLKTKEDLDESIMIANTNKQVHKLNSGFREACFRSNQYLINKGEKLIVTDNNYQLETAMMNGAFLKVREVYESETIESIVNIKDGQYYESCDYIRRIDTDKLKVSLTFRDLLVETSTGELVMIKILETFLFSPEPQISKVISQALFKIVFIDVKSKNPDAKGEDFKYELEKAISSNPYFNVIKAKFGYAITCHKAQGGEWKKVFVNIWGKDVNSHSHYKWVYTAFTRATSHLYIESMTTGRNETAARFLSKSWG